MNSCRAASWTTSRDVAVHRWPDVEGSPRGRLHCEIHLCIGHDEKDVLRAELQRAPLHEAPAPLGDLAADLQEPVKEMARISGCSTIGAPHSSP